MVHLAAFGLFSAYVLALAVRGVAQWQLAWTYWRPIDWPMSEILWLPLPREPISWLPYQFADPLWFIYPCIVYGLLGSLWYGALGAVLAWLWDFIVGRRRTRRAGRRTTG